MAINHTTADPLGLNGNDHILQPNVPFIDESQHHRSNDEDDTTAQPPPHPLTGNDHSNDSILDHNADVVFAPPLPYNNKDEVIDHQPRSESRASRVSRGGRISRASRASRASTMMTTASQANQYLQVRHMMLNKRSRWSNLSCIQRKDDVIPIQQNENCDEDYLPNYEEATTIKAWKKVTKFWQSFHKVYGTRANKILRGIHFCYFWVAVIFPIVEFGVIPENFTFNIVNITFSVIFACLAVADQIITYRKTNDEDFMRKFQFIQRIANILALYISIICDVMAFVVEKQFSGNSFFDRFNTFLLIYATVELFVLLGELLFMLHKVIRDFNRRHPSASQAGISLGIPIGFRLFVAFIMNVAIFIIMVCAFGIEAYYENKDTSDYITTDTSRFMICMIILIPWLNLVVFMAMNTQCYFEILLILCMDEVIDEGGEQAEDMAEKKDDYLHMDKAIRFFDYITDSYVLIFLLSLWYVLLWAYFIVVVPIPRNAFPALLILALTVLSNPTAFIYASTTILYNINKVLIYTILICSCNCRNSNTDEENDPEDPMKPKGVHNICDCLLAFPVYTIYYLLKILDYFHNLVEDEDAVLRVPAVLTRCCRY